MRFFTLSAAALTLVTSALAQKAGFDAMSKPGEGEKVPAGSTYAITWEPNDVKGKIDITLLGGTDGAHLEDLGKIATSVDNQAGSFDWKVDGKLGDKKTYGLQIVLQSDSSFMQYSFPFQITAKEGATSNSDASTTASGTTSGTATGSASSSSSTSSASKASNGTSSGTSSSATASSTAVITGAKNSTMTASSTATQSGTTLTSMTTATGTRSSSTPATVPTNAAAPRVVSGFAVLGGLAAALL